MRVLFLIAIFFGSTSAFAFPEMVRHGYANCMTCHYSPNGGGVLTEYGRALSSEALSMAGGETEGSFLYGLLHLPKEVIAGGDVRILQNFQSLNGRSTFKFIPMQADLELGADVKPVTAVATVGVDYNGDFISRRHYVTYQPVDKVVVRGGRFLPSFGINSENHTIASRRGIGKDQSTESYNLEGAYITEEWDAFVTAIFGRPDDKTLGAEAGLSASGSFFLTKKYKLGLSYYYGSRDISTRHLLGPFALLGFTPRFFILAQMYYQTLSPRIGQANSISGFVDDLRVDYELLKGLHVYAIQEYAALAANSGRQSYGLGVQFFPRPHFEFNLLYQITKISGASTFGDFAFLMAHYYF